MNILSVNNKKEEKILRKRPADFDFGKYTKKEINELIRSMRVTMIKANGIGLAANQIGLDMRMFVAHLPKKSTTHNLQPATQFYAIFNPEVIKFSKEKTLLDEGCLSVPGGIFGEVERPNKITLVGQDKSGKKIKIKAWGLLARVFQHEVDHLNGFLFVDKAITIKKIAPKS